MPLPITRERPIRVLVVDDSAVMRQTMASLLSPPLGFRVDVAADPIIAFEKIKVARPDVILLDLEMPRMDGLTFLRRLMTQDPIPVVVCSALASADAGLRALEEGALELVAKPRLGVRDFLHESLLTLADALRAASVARPRRRRGPDASPAAMETAPYRPTLNVTTDKIVALGASTGGTEALRAVLQQMPPDGPAIVVVQHMPEGFTRSFAARLDEICRIAVKEAASGDRLVPGRALIAPGNRHLLVRRTGAHYLVDVTDGPAVSRHRPSVDVLFRSVAESAGPNAVGVIMTGMGRDGTEGLLEMKRAGAVTLSQDEETSVVFGMPKEAIAAGAVDAIVPLPRLAATILGRIGAMGNALRPPNRTSAQDG